MRLKQSLAGHDPLGVESLVQQPLSWGVHLRGKTRGLGGEHVHTGWVMLAVVPPSDIILPHPHWVLRGTTMRKKR